MTPFMVLGTKLRNFLHLPGIHIKAKEKDKCICCNKSNKGCPIGMDVVIELKNDVIDNLECIQRGACVDICPQQILSYRMTIRKENNNGK